MHGKNYIGYELSGKSEKTIDSIEANGWHKREYSFHLATEEELNRAINKANSCFDAFSQTSGLKRAEFLETIAEEILKLDEELIRNVQKESGLPETRIVGERGRTIGQLRSFAQLIREGSWVQASIDLAKPERTPVSKPDIRKVFQPLGPIAVFGAGNFPLAFSSAGGDTAAALASGCPVVYKAHEGHPATSNLIAGAIQKAGKKSEMPDGVFSSVFGDFKLGEQLVKNPFIKGMAFTGSFAGGKALLKHIQQREEPIPAFCEMGSVNPLVIFEQNEKELTELSETIAGSILLGAGQFCTKPGLILVEKGPNADKLIKSIQDLLSNATPQTMLNEKTWRGYDSGLTKSGIKIEQEVCKASAASTLLTAGEFISDEKFQYEVFGPYACLILCNNVEEIDAVLNSLEGQLTLSLFGNPNQLDAQKISLNKWTRKAGRVIFNGVPTGVEVCPSMHHGGPWPASSDSRFTSVGTDSIYRFVRPVSFQNFPQEALPLELKNDNPLNIIRRIDGNFTRNKL